MKRKSSSDRRGERAFLMDFGAVAVGAGTTRHVELRNASGETVTASPTQLDHEGVFSALAAFRPIPPNAVARLPIEFRPRREAAHEDVFVLRTPVGNARVVLRGEGVASLEDAFDALEEAEASDAREGEGLGGGSVWGKR